MSPTADPILDFQSAPLNPRGLPTSETAHDDKKNLETEDNIMPVVGSHGGEAEHMDSELIPTEEDMLTLRKVAGPLP